MQRKLSLTSQIVWRMVNGNEFSRVHKLCYPIAPVMSEYLRQQRQKRRSEMKDFTMDMIYYYNVTLQYNKATDTYSVITTYGEVIAICDSGHGVIKTLLELENGAYA